MLEPVMISDLEETAMSKPWQTDMWFTSPWNFDAEVRARIAFDRIRVSTM